MTATKPEVFRPYRTRKPTVDTADLRLHRIACLARTAGTSWSDRCGCQHVRGRHDAARHEPITTTAAGITRTCTGRNLAGACLWPDCNCATFTNTDTNPRLRPNRGQS